MIEFMRENAIMTLNEYKVRTDKKEKMKILKNKYLSVQFTKQAKYKANLLFEKIYSKVFEAENIIQINKSGEVDDMINKLYL
jgi:hypothetical protein